MVKYTTKSNDGDGSAIEDPSDTGFQPVDFQPINPWKSAELITARRNLPHLETTGATYFVTFRCKKGLIIPLQTREEVLSAIRHWDGIRIFLDAAVVMPDHVHAIFRIIDEAKLSEIMHSIKSFSANRINKFLNRSGAFWLDEYFDHVIRQAEEWYEKFDYIRQNAVNKGLVESPNDYPYLYPNNSKQEDHRLEACATRGNPV